MSLFQRSYVVLADKKKKKLIEVSANLSSLRSLNLGNVSVPENSRYFCIGINDWIEVSRNSVKA